jgi:hypothetical protein
MDRNYIQTGLKPGQHEELRTYWGWSILAPACPGWGEIGLSSTRRLSKNTKMPITKMCRGWTC